MTLLILLSLFPIRRKYYEFFYAAHVILVAATLIMSALHHPPVWWWCWAALGLWGGERIWRATWWLSTNGFMGGKSGLTPTQLAAAANMGKVEHWEMKPLTAPAAALLESQAFPLPAYAGGTGIGTADSSPRDSVDSSRQHYQPYHRTSLSHPSDHHFVNTTSSYVPPPGYVLAELVAGSTVRLRFITPGFLPWAPGQHFLITIPAVSRVTSHPFTCASICDEQAPTDAGREMLMFVRAKQGWTKDLWDTVVRLLARGQTHAPSDHPPQGYPKPPKGVLMRIYVDGPFGSAARARWAEHSTVLIVVGGSGVSFGLAVLQYACMCLAGRDGRYLGARPGGWGKKGFLMRRVRFVWIIRDFCKLLKCEHHYIFRVLTEQKKSTYTVVCVNFETMPGYGACAGVADRYLRDEFQIVACATSEAVIITIDRATMAHFYSQSNQHARRDTRGAPRATRATVCAGS
jgi:hypothetical protein